jgi:hypothetical protein
VPRYLPTSVYDQGRIASQAGAAQLVASVPGPGVIQTFQVLDQGSNSVPAGQTGWSIINFDLASGHLWAPSALQPGTVAGKERFIFPVSEAIAAVRPDLTQSAAGVVSNQAGAALPVDTVVSFFNSVQAAAFSISHTVAGAVSAASMSLSGPMYFSARLDIYVIFLSAAAGLTASTRATIWREVG